MMERVRAPGDNAPEADFLPYSPIDQPSRDLQVVRYCRSAAKCIDER